MGFSGDVFRQTFRELSESEKQRMAELKAKAQELYDMMELMMHSDNGRELALAKTNLEQAVMWAIKGHTK